LLVRNIRKSQAEAIDDTNTSSKKERLNLLQRSNPRNQLFQSWIREVDLAGQITNLIQEERELHGSGFGRTDAPVSIKKNTKKVCGDVS
jgi:hypothetical protein